MSSEDQLKKLQEENTLLQQQIVLLQNNEQILTDSEQKLKAVFDSSKHLHIILDTDARCFWFNKKAAAATKILFNKELYLGTYDHKYIPERMLPSYREYFKRCLQGETVTYEREYTTYAGDLCYLEMTLQPVYMDDQKLIGVSMIGIDITERRSYEDKLKTVNKELVQQNMQLNQYSYIISHNLRGPIVTLLGLTDVFERFDHDTKLQTEVVGHIKKSAIHLDNIIRDLNLILSNSENTDLLKVDINLEVEVSIVKDLLKSQIEAAHASILTEFEVINIQSVRSYVQSILLNLMSNSLKYKKPDIPSVIRIKTERLDSNIVCLSFSDNGLGFDLEKNKDKIFGFYKRFHSHVEGKGLGLYLLKNQVEILKGKVEVESQINQGTTFRIFLTI